MRTWIAKRAALLTLLAVSALLLGGCTTRIQEREPADLSGDEIEAGVPVPETDGADDRQLSATLYFVDEDGGTLVPVTRRITALAGESRAQAALAALLAGPTAGERGVTWPDLGTSRSERLLEVSGGVATVDLPARARLLDQETLYAVRVAIVNTLTEFSEIAHVNVLIGGREEGLDLGATLPVGTMTRENDLNAEARYRRMDEERMSEEGITRLTTLYYPSADGRMILPEVRSVAYAQVSPIEYLYTILTELGKGATHALACRNVPAPMDYIVEMPEIVRTDDGYLAIELRLSGELDEALLEAGLTRGVYMAMLTDTLMGFVPGVEGLLVSIGSDVLTGLEANETPDGREIEFAQKLAARGDFDGYVGAPVKLYAMDEESGALIGIERVLEQSKALDARERLTALMRLSDEGFFTLPYGVKEEDILAVHVGGEAIAVNLSGAFAQEMTTLTHTHERVAVYAMVNTLTEDMDASSVVFFFDGKQVQTLAGALEMRGGFVRNPGFVED